MERLTAKLRRLYRENREGISYLFFGVLTTAVNYAAFLLFNWLLGDRWVLLTNLIAFLIALLFAYAVNKQYVFQSRDWSFSVVRRELASFTAARVFSFLVEEAGLWAAAYVLHLERYRLFGPVDGILLAKLALSVLVVVMNYFFSKFLVFAKRRGT